MIIEPGLAQVPISRQCELVGLPTSTYYYQPATESDENLLLMRLIDEIYTDKPFYGKRRITVRLNSDTRPLQSALSSSSQKRGQKDIFVGEDEKLLLYFPNRFMGKLMESDRLWSQSPCARL